MIEKEVENFPGEKHTVHYLNIENLLADNGKLTQNWINTTRFRISNLLIISMEIDNIENNAFKGYAFETLTSMYLLGLKTDTLEEGTFEGLQLLRNLTLYKMEIKHINENAFKAISPNLELLTISEMILPFNPTNLTGTIPLPKLTTVYIVNNKIVSLDAGSFSGIDNVIYLFLDWNYIKHVGCGTFEKMTSLQYFSLGANLLTTLDSCVFSDEVINSLYLMWMARNVWDCNCDLVWLKQLKLDRIIIDDPLCASHSNLLFEEVDFCEEKI
ncbi:podocan-like [Arctopsyche grandis]|uniref:podocan-like n=1 Tax=Arctopsyche grandis TaxID=121162 RepID=UPI00406D89A9